ncbi:MAG TPA: thioredoxin domain-containing protein, partial [Candidatus Methylomirabilis sp.]|nr:thioredoxin domain-containing protein [Candidatus Methylomirabilis sp.]
LLRPEDAPTKGPPRAPEIRPTDPLLSGNASSAVTLIVFGDFQCEYCRNQAQAVEDALRLTGWRDSVRVVWRDLPLVSQHPRAMAAATVAACSAQQGRFRQMHDALFFRAKDLSDTEFLAFAKELNLDIDDFLVCLRDPAISFRLTKDVELARSLAVIEVPIMFLDGIPVSGYVDAPSLAEALRKKLSASATSKTR